MGKIQSALNGLVDAPILALFSAILIGTTTCACQRPLMDFPKFHLTDVKPER